MNKNISEAQIAYSVLEFCTKALKVHPFDSEVLDTTFAKLSNQLSIDGDKKLYDLQLAHILLTQLLPEGKFKDVEEFKEKLKYIELNYYNYHPRLWVTNNLTNKLSSKILIDIIT